MSDVAFRVNAWLTDSAQLKSQADGAPRRPSGAAKNAQQNPGRAAGVLLRLGLANRKEKPRTLIFAGPPLLSGHRVDLRGPGCPSRSEALLQIDCSKFRRGRVSHRIIGPSRLAFEEGALLDDKRLMADVALHMAR